MFAPYMNNPPLSNHMKRPLLVSCFSLALLSALLAGCGKDAKEKEKAAPTAKNAKPVAGLESDEQKVSYGIGYNFGGSLSKQSEFTLDQKALKAGVEDGLATTKTRISEEDLQAAFTAVQQRVAAAAAAAGEKNQAAAAAFLAKNKTRAGVTTTASGLQYEVLTKGNGAKPKSTDTVTVHYHGTLLDGTVFDSSVDRGEPATFPVTGVIKGWVEALPLMSVGDKWKLFIAPDLAYGPRANGKIPANSALVFEVQLISIGSK